MGPPVSLMHRYVSYTRMPWRMELHIRILFVTESKQVQNYVQVFAQEIIALNNTSTMAKWIAKTNSSELMSQHLWDVK